MWNKAGFTEAFEGPVDVANRVAELLMLRMGNLASARCWQCSPVHLSVCLSVCLSVWLSLSISLCSSLSLSISLTPSLSLSKYISIYAFFFLSAYLSCLISIPRLIPSQHRLGRDGVKSQRLMRFKRVLRGGQGRRGCQDRLVHRNLG